MASPGTGAFVTFRVPFGRPRRRRGGVACAGAGSGTGTTRVDKPSLSDALEESLLASPLSLSDAPATMVHARAARARTHPTASPPGPVRHRPLSNRTPHRATRVSCPPARARAATGAREAERVAGVTAHDPPHAHIVRAVAIAVTRVPPCDALSG
jgi:hypothetical protein